MLLILALPLQTFASAAMLGCMYSQPVEALEQMATDGGMMAGCHEQESPDAPPAQHNCNHCAACALASVLPIPVTGTPVIISTPSRLTLQSTALFSGYIPEGPERPPRSPLV